MQDPIKTSTAILKDNRRVTLVPPILSGDHLLEKIVCIRGHRERIFNVSAQMQDPKLIIHNYGHGGAGWTFLFGCVEESLRCFENALAITHRFRDQPVCVIGAGCYGLLTAITLARKGWRVKIIAKEREAITSYKSAGFFFPRARVCSNEAERAIFKSLGIESYKNYLQIARGTHPYFQTGAKIIPAYYGLAIDPGFEPYIQQKLIETPELVTIDFHNGKSYEAWQYKAIFIDVTSMMHELNEAIKLYSIPIEIREIGHFDEIAEPIVFNCSGLGAKRLAEDKRIIPVQGHLIMLKNQPALVKQPYMLNMKVIMVNPNGSLRDELIYYAPKNEGILGITFIRGQDSLTANQHEFDRLMRRCNDFFGSSKELMPIEQENLQKPMSGSF